MIVVVLEVTAGDSYERKYAVDPDPRSVARAIRNLWELAECPWSFTVNVTQEVSE